jgi:hypothetical protein
VWIAGRYRNDFLRSNGEWRIHHLRVENLFATPYENGWAKTPFAPQRLPTNTQPKGDVQ